MPQSNQEYTARRFQSFDTENTPPGYDADYECELPPDVRTELVAPKRPRILGRKTSGTLKPTVKWPLYLALLVATIIIGALALLWRQQQSAERAKTNQAISQPALTPQLQPSPTPAATPVPLPPGSAELWKEYLANNAPAPRAELVKPAPRAELIKLPAPRAQLVSDLPPLVPSQHYLATMPYLDLEVLTTYKGRLASENMLPKSGNQLGDTWLIGETFWTWIVAPGATHADWIDP